MRIRQKIHCVLLAPDPVFSDQWTSWCPELDVVTCGDHPDHAVAMLEEAIGITVENAVSAHYFDSAGDRRPKKVMHPSRLGRFSKEDDEWKTFQELKFQNDKLHSGWFALSELEDGLDEKILVEGYLEVETRSGVVKVNPWLQDQGFVPSELFQVEYEFRDVRHKRFSVRSSVLKQAGEDGQKLVLDEAAAVLGNLKDELVDVARVKRIDK